MVTVSLDKASLIAKTRDIAKFHISDLHIEIAMELYSKNDPAHQYDHALAVMIEADNIIGCHAELEKWRNHIMLGCLFHDSHCHVNRDKHHILGAEHALRILGDNPAGYKMTRAGVYLVAQAILEHRASWKTLRISPVSDVVASADRGRPNLQKYIKRAVQCRYNENPATEMDQIIGDSLAHIHEKFGEDGYAWESYPRYAMMSHRDDINRMKTFLASQSRCADLIEYARDNFREWVS